jgi:hypothetical protein
LNARGFGQVLYVKQNRSAVLKKEKRKRKKVCFCDPQTFYEKSRALVVRYGKSLMWILAWSYRKDKKGLTFTERDARNVGNAARTAFPRVHCSGRAREHVTLTHTRQPVATPTLLENERNCRNSYPRSTTARNPLSPRHPLPDPTAMARPHALPLLALLVLSAAAADAAGLGGPDTLVGGWSPIPDVGAARIQELGGWALGKAKETRLVGDGLRFRRVTCGEQQVVAGMNYRIVLDAADPSGQSAPYVAVVFEQLWTSTRELKSFKPVTSAH